jgi:hypothetical protein
MKTMKLIDGREINVFDKIQNINIGSLTPEKFYVIDMSDGSCWMPVLDKETGKIGWKIASQLMHLIAFNREKL